MNKICNVEYDNELSKRINTRHFPSQELKPSFDPRPCSTKYTMINHARETVPNTPTKKDSDEGETLRNYKEYNVESVFYSGNKVAPRSYYLDHVNTESELRNQINPLKKSDIGKYIPPVDSQLYKASAGFVDNNLAPERELSRTVRGVDNKKCDLAPNAFFNTTRMNVKNL